MLSGRINTLAEREEPLRSKCLVMKGIFVPLCFGCKGRTASPQSVRASVPCVCHKAPGVFPGALLAWNLQSCGRRRRVTKCGKGSG